jgi:hypothetical protein
LNDNPRFPLLRIMLGNAFLLSGLYLGLGLVVEVMRRWFPSERVDMISLTLDSLPGRVLMLLGVMPKLRELYLYHSLSNGTLRLIFALTTMGVIFALALVVGAGMFCVAKLAERGKPGQPTSGA